MKERRLVIVADDVGLCSEINQAVAEGHQAGVIQAASLLVTGAAYDDAVPLLRSLPRLAAGLHVALVETPLLLSQDEIPDLYQDGRPFASHREFLAAWLRGRISRASIEREMRAQFARYAASGLPLTHVNGHQHLHLLPGILETLLDICSEHGVTYVRIPDEPLTARRMLPALGLNVLGWRARRLLRARGMHCADHFRGFGEAGHMTAAALHRILEKLPAGGTEIVCHVAHSGPGLRPYDSWGYMWDEERRAFVASILLERLRSDQIQLCTFDGLAPHRDVPLPAVPFAALREASTPGSKV